MAESHLVTLVTSLCRIPSCSHRNSCWLSSARPPVFCRLLVWDAENAAVTNDLGESVPPGALVELARRQAEGASRHSFGREAVPNA